MADKDKIIKAARNVAGNGAVNSLQEITPHVNIATGFTIPPVIPWKLRDATFGALRDDRLTDDSNAIARASYCPVSLKYFTPGNAERLKGMTDEERRSMKGDMQLDFPLDPLVGISGGNSVVKRSVLKHNRDMRYRGTIKELWATNDYAISISGMLVGEDGEYPSDLVMQLRNFCELREPIVVECRLLDNFNIRNVVIESFEFPFTKGMENQMFSLQCTSDDDFDLLVKDPVK